jgi:serine/threonine protein kinase
MSSPDTSSTSSEPISDWTPPAIEELASDFPSLEIESLLAQGGMSAVYLARQRSLDRRVVLKVLPVEIGADADAADRFMREARVLAKLRDPGIVEIYDSGLSPGGHLFLVLEWEEGGDLRHWAHGGVALDEALGIGESVCSALASAHAESIIHGDIKPDNIFIDGKGRLKVGDFGLADVSGSLAVFHTPGYTAPEIFRTGATACVQTDVYAVGAMVFELIYQQIPPDTSEERAAMLVSLPPAASRALGQMLAEDPAKRPATAEAARKAFTDARRALNTSPPPRRAAAPRPAATGSAAAAAWAPPVTPGTRKRPTRRRAERPMAAAPSSGGGKFIAAAAIAVIGIGVAIIVTRKSPEKDLGGPTPPIASNPKPAESTPEPKSKESNGIFDFPEKKETPATTAPEKTTAAASPASTPASNPFRTASSVAVTPAKEEEPTAPEPIDPALVPLRQRYTTALNNAAKTAEQAKDPAKVLAFRTEVAIIERGGSPPDLDAPGIPPELAKLRAIYRKEAAALATPPASPVATPTATASTGKPPVGMPSDAVPFNGKWYRFYPENPTWHAAKEKCSRLNGMLAVIPDKATWDFVKGLIGEKWVWLGATDEKSEGVWTWSDGTQLTFKKWQKDEPNNTDAKQHYLRASNKGWRDDEKKAPEIDGYLCEWRPQ